LPEDTWSMTRPKWIKTCPQCGLPRVRIADETSEELEVELRVRRIVHHRLTYAATCRCAGTEPIVRGAAPVKLIPRGSLSMGTIAWAVVACYMWGLLRHRITTILEQHGAQVPDGTFVGVFHGVQPLLQPIHEAVCARNGFPSFGMFTRRTGCGWYVPGHRSLCSFSRNPLMPPGPFSMAANPMPSIPAAPSFATAWAHAHCSTSIPHIVLCRLRYLRFGCCFACSPRAARNGRDPSPYVWVTPHSPPLPRTTLSTS
jgi:hypothetical protein